MILKLIREQKLSSICRGSMKSFAGYSKDSFNESATHKSYGGSIIKQETIADVLKYPIIAVPDASITHRVAKYLGIRSKLSQEDGETVVATYYPSYDKYGKLTGFKKVDWTIPKEQKYHFTNVGIVKPTNQFFGQVQASRGINKKQLNILEGEGDLCAALESYMLAMESMRKSTNKSIASYASAILDGIESASNGDFKEGIPTLPLVSLNCGCAAATETCASNQKFITSYDKLVLALDNDEASAIEKTKGIIKGREATDLIAGFLLSENIFTFKYPDQVNDPDGAKDIRDLYDKGMWDYIYSGFTKCDNKYVPDKLISLSNVSVDNLRRKKKDGVLLSQLPKLYDYTKGPRTGELWTLTGPSGAGKSTVTKKIEYDIIQYLKGFGDRLDGFTEDEKCALIHLEEDEDETINTLYAEELGLDPKAFSADPSEFLTVEEHSEIHNRWCKEDKVKIFDHFGSIPISDLMQKLKQMVFLDKCRWIILDHLSMVISGLQTNDERKMLDIVMTELAAFCKQYDVFILVVSHIKRTDVQMPKDKDETFWHPVRKEQLRGSASLEQLSWIVLAVEPEELPDRSRGRCRVVSLKNRPHKKLGVCDTFWMTSDGKLHDAFDWSFESGKFVDQAGSDVVHNLESSIKLKTKYKIERVDSSDESDPFL